MSRDDWDNWNTQRDLSNLRDVGLDLASTGRLVDARLVLRAFVALGGEHEELAGPEEPEPQTG